ncbi:plasmid stabilization protein [Paraburkholderia madseniana]|uniref:Plasmid stabilization protein n=1 Tax=Paraburkholderia madseniana TaxID=2599607 RepID=A0A6N6W4E7_9BURK|nr:plasmid stabilization protein [Paraburkholderia madseniana]KAE8755323.1 plasmid stabilization protein [Paraburkholderia madseniana]
MRFRERLCVELGAVRPRWDAWCARRGVTVGEGVRQLIAVAVNAEADDRPVEIESGLTRPIVGESRSRIEIRLTAAEKMVVEQRAAASGLHSNRWIVALIRAQLTGEPQLGARELLLLSASNQQLAVISRSLGQLARGGGAGFTCQELADFEGIREKIDAHLRAVTGVVRANLDRWSR